MGPFIARLRESERAWSVALFSGLWLVLASGSQVGLRPEELLAQAQAAALGTLLALWVARASGLRRHGLAIALATLFTTPLLPYAFVARDLTLPLLLLVTGFLAIGPTRLRPPARDVGLLLASVGSLLCSPSGLLLLPALLWLNWCAAGRRGAERRTGTKPGLYAATTLLLVLFSARVWSLDPTAIAFASSPVEWLVHVHGFLLSLNKGLVLFAPLVVIGLWRAFRGAVSDRQVARFALLSATCLMVPFSGLDNWTDAAWGPRPLLAAIAPALLALALSHTERARRGGHRRWIMAAVICGLAVNTLGTAVPQGALAELARQERGTTLADLQFDPSWSHPRVNARLLGGWLMNSFRPSTVAETAATLAGTSVSRVVQPGPVLLRVFDATGGGALLPLALFLGLLGACGWTLLVLVRHAAMT